MRALSPVTCLVACLLICLPAGLAQTQEPAVPGEEQPAPAAEAVPEKPAPYDQRLFRLSEIIGSVHYLRTLCKAEDADSWRVSMQSLLEREAGQEVGRKARLTASFNRGYRTFASVYTTCTDAAVTAEAQYRAQGATLAAEIVARFGN